MKILFLADTHLGFDLPNNPRILRRRRAGDVFFRSRIPASILERGFTPLIDLAGMGKKLARAI